MSAQLKPTQLEDGGIDAGLLLLVATTPPDRVWGHREIAYVCGCSRTMIWLIEQAALRKLAKTLERRGCRNMAQVLNSR